MDSTFNAYGKCRNMFYLLFAIHFGFISSDRNKDTGNLWPNIYKYYFQDLQSKTSTIMAPKCFKSLIHLPNSSFDTEIIDSGNVFISSFPIDSTMLNWWRSIPSPKQMRVEPLLCTHPYTRKRPIFNNSGCQLPQYMDPFAPRCQVQYLKWICDNANIPFEDVSNSRFVLPESKHATSFIPPQPWLLRTKNSLVSMCGDIITECGLIHTTSNCMGVKQQYEAKLFQKSCPLHKFKHASLASSNNTTCKKDAPWSREVEFHDRVFVVAEVDDTFVYHIHVEIMPRIIYHLDYLLKNPDIKILISCDTQKKPAQTLSGIRHGLMSMKPLMEMAGLSMDRLIVHKHVFAKDVYFPMEGGCQDPVYNTWQILRMRSLFLTKLGYSPTEVLTTKPRTILLMKRSSRAKHTRNNHDLVRQWSDEFTEEIVKALESTFSDLKVVLFSDRNISLMSCHSCQIQQFAEANVLIGVHGAGLANMLYMEPNSAVIEIGPYGNDGRILLGGGPFSRMAAVMSHNYMIHHPPFEEYEWMNSDKTCKFNITRFIIHVRSYLMSIDFV